MSHHMFFSTRFLILCENAEKNDIGARVYLSGFLEDPHEVEKTVIMLCRNRCWTTHANALVAQSTSPAKQYTVHLYSMNLFSE